MHYKRNYEKICVKLAGCLHQMDVIYIKIYQLGLFVCFTRSYLDLVQLHIMTKDKSDSTENTIIILSSNI